MTPSPPAKLGKPGATLERLVMSDQGFSGCPVVLTQVSQSARRIGPKPTDVVPIKGPCDFFGTVKRTGRAIVFDAKHCNRKSSFDANGKKVLPHQVRELIRHGEAGAIAGLLVMDWQGRLYWVGWQKLISRPASYRWDSLMRAGFYTAGVDWQKLLSCDPAGAGAMS